MGKVWPWLNHLAGNHWKVPQCTDYLLGAKLGKDTRWWRYHKDGRSPRQDCEQDRRSQVQISLPARFFTSKFPLIYSLHKLLAFIHVRPPKIIQVFYQSKRVHIQSWNKYLGLNRLLLQRTSPNTLLWLIARFVLLEYRLIHQGY